MPETTQSDDTLKPNILFISSNKNKLLLAIDGYVYQRNKTTPKVSYWKCEDRTCGAGVHLSPQNAFIKFTAMDHNHMPIPERVEIRKMMTSIKARVNSESTAIGQIYNEELTKANLSKSALAVAATAREANSGLNQARRALTPVLPTSIDFDIPRKYTKTTDGERYLLADRVQRCGGDVGKRIIVFATDEQLRMLFTCSHIFMDGTFDTCPSHFDQIYSVHGLKNDNSFVCVIALLGGRSTIIYKELFSILSQHARRLGLRFRPAKITTDFEAALIKTVADELPNSRHVGCNFHFVQSIHRQIQRLQLTNLYRDDDSARSTARKLMGLAHVPEESVERAFEQIASEAPESMEPLIDYFNRFWMTKVKWSLWNVSDVEVKTNNLVEGWNHRFNRLVAKYHPNIWYLFDCIKKEEVLVRQQMLKMTMGGKQKKNQRSILLQTHISTLRLRFDENQISLDDLLYGLSLLIGTSR